MGRSITLINREKFGQQFAGLILPDVLERLQEEQIILIGALEDGEPLGAAVVELLPEYGELLSIAVLEDRRREGIGTGLVNECIRLLRFLSSNGMYAFLQGKEKSAAALLQSCGFAVSEEETWQFSLSQLPKKLMSATRAHTLALSQVPIYQFRSYLGHVFPACPWQVKRDSFDRSLSRVVVEQERIRGSILVEREEGALSIGWLHSNSSNKQVPMLLILDAVTLAARTMPPDTLVRFMAWNPALLKLAEKLIGGGMERRTEQRWELLDGIFRLKDLTKIWEV